MYFPTGETDISARDYLDDGDIMIYLIAFASSDGVNIDRHFGNAEKFYIVKLDTRKLDGDIVKQKTVSPACMGGIHEISGFDGVLEALGGVSAIVAQRIGNGAREYITQNGIAVYQMPLQIEQALCLLMEEKQWEVDKWLSHMKN